MTVVKGKMYQSRRWFDSGHYNREFISEGGPKGKERGLGFHRSKAGDSSVYLMGIMMNNRDEFFLKICKSIVVLYR